MEKQVYILLSFFTNEYQLKLGIIIYDLLLNQTIIYTIKYF